MLAATILALAGSMRKCGLPSECTSPLARSSVVGTSGILTRARAHAASRRAGEAEENFSFCMTSEFVGCVSAHDEFELGPEAVVGPKNLVVVAVVLQAEAREFRRIPGEVRRKPGPIDAALGDDRRWISAHLLGAEAEHDA